MKRTKAHARFWFVHAVDDHHRTVNLAVSAFTATSARRQARKRMGTGGSITSVNPVHYAHAWVMDFLWPLPTKIGNRN